MRSFAAYGAWFITESPVFADFVLEDQISIAFVDLLLIHPISKNPKA